MIVRYSLPRFVEVGVTQTLDLDVYDAAGTQQTVSSGTITVYLGAEKLVDAATLAAFGPPVTYSLAGSLHTDRSPSEDYLEVWDTDLGRFQREGYLVRLAYRSTITDTDLTDRHSELLTFSSKVGGYQQYRDEAHVEVQMMMLERGRRPWLVFDRAALRRLELYKTFELVFNDFMSVVGDGKWERLRDSYAAKYERALEGINFRYDDAELGTIDNGGHRQSASGPVMVTAGPRRRFIGAGRGGF